ncbi:MAG: APC family permease [bacterium]|nr:APC family permease [bacterium]
MTSKIRRIILGSPYDVNNPGIYHRITLIAILAWVGLGADGLSSSSYGPEEAFKVLGDHRYLAVMLAIGTTFTVFIISTVYRGIINHFPFGGGGYIVAGKLLGPRFGVVSGSALLIDYVLTVAVSIACCADQFFSFLPLGWHIFKLPVEALLILLLILLNLRGTKESILVLAPIFFLFLITHAILIFGGIGSHVQDLPAVTNEVKVGFQNGFATLGFMGIAALFFRSFSMGAGTYTGLEAVSNGLQIMREPKVETGKRTMLYMAISLSVTASGILLCYLLFNVAPVVGKTMNAVLLERFAGNWQPNGVNLGHGYVILALISEAALLVVGAQAGFIDGPRVMSNMAMDGWLPRRLSQLSDRLTMQFGILLIGVSSLVVLFYTRGNITTLVTMYSINVFLTFTLSMTGMCRFWLNERRKNVPWIWPFTINAVGLVTCLSILIIVIIEKFERGAWITLVVTSTLIGLCFIIHGHYQFVRENVTRLNKILENLPAYVIKVEAPLDPSLHTAVMLVSGFSILGVHQFLQVHKIFPGQYKNFLFVSVGVIDSASMKGIEEVDRIKKQTEDSLQKYVSLAQKLGYSAGFRMGIGTEALEEAARLCLEIHKEFPLALFIMGKLVFDNEGWYHRILHNETAYQLLRKLNLEGLNAMVLSVRLDEAEDVLRNELPSF